MTIREQLNKQLLQTRLIAFGAWLAFAMSLFLPNSLPVHGLTGIAFGICRLRWNHFISHPLPSVPTPHWARNEHNRQD